MIRVKKEDMHRIAPLFRGFEDSMVFSCLQGYMGNAFATQLDDPKAALIVSGEYSFFAGDATSPEALKLVRNLFEVNESDSTIVIFDDADLEWEKLLLSVAENNPVVVPRFGIAQKDYDFDSRMLQDYVDALPAGFDLVGFDEALYHQALAEEWSKEFCEVFASAEDYLARGFGFAVCKDGVLAAGASTMTVYDGGIEIQVATSEEFRRQGLGLSCAAALLQECVKRKLRPCWDAANLVSKKMALKLGYEYKGEYMTIHMKKKIS